MGDAHRVHQLGLHPRAAATLRRIRRRGPRLPPGTGWTADPYVAPLRFAYGPRDANQVLKLLTSDALRAIRGHHTTAAAAVPTAASGTVIGVMAGRGMVSLNGPGKGMASIWTELIADNVPDDRVVRAGMAVHGKLDPQSRRLTLEGMRLSPTDALAPYEPGEVVLAIVRSVATEVCVVELLPGFAVSVAAADVIATKRRIDLRRLMTVGETLLARVVETGPTADQWRLSLVDIEIDDVAIPAPPILAGGPPWLIPPDDADDADDGAEAVADSFGATVGAADSGPGIYAPEPSVPPLRRVTRPPPPSILPCSKPSPWNAISCSTSWAASASSGARRPRSSKPCVPRYAGPAGSPSGCRPRTPGCAPNWAAPPGTSRCSPIRSNSSASRSTRRGRAVSPPHRRASYLWPPGRSARTSWTR